MPSLSKQGLFKKTGGISVQPIAAACDLLQNGPVAGEAGARLGGGAKLDCSDRAIAEAELNAGCVMAAKAIPVGAVLTGGGGRAQGRGGINATRQIGTAQAIAGAHRSDAKPGPDMPPWADTIASQAFAEHEGVAGAILYGELAEGELRAIAHHSFKHAVEVGHFTIASGAGHTGVVGTAQSIGVGGVADVFRMQSDNEAIGDVSGQDSSLGRLLIDRVAGTLEHLQTHLAGRGLYVPQGGPPGIVFLGEFSF